LALYEVQLDRLTFHLFGEDEEARVPGETVIVIAMAEVCVADTLTTGCPKFLGAEVTFQATQTDGQSASLRGLLDEGGKIGGIGGVFEMYEGQELVLSLEVHSGKIQAEVTQTAEAWMDVWRANDCALSRSVWHPERIAQPRAGKTGFSVDDWIENCTTTMSNRASFSGEWMNTEVRVLSPNAALFEGTYTATYEYRDGSPSNHYPTAAQVMLFERTDTGWGLTFFVNSNGPTEPAGEGVEQ
jgi:hypothetical protein